MKPRENMLRIILKKNAEIDYSKMKSAKEMSIFHSTWPVGEKHNECLKCIKWEVQIIHSEHAASFRPEPYLNGRCLKL
jgi:hypothetical protein